MRCRGGYLDGMEWPVHGLSEGDILELPGAENMLKLVADRFSTWENACGEVHCAT